MGLGEVVVEVGLLDAVAAVFVREEAFVAAAVAAEADIHSLVLGVDHQLVRIGSASDRAVDLGAGWEGRAYLS